MKGSSYSTLMICIAVHLDHNQCASLTKTTKYLAVMLLCRKAEISSYVMKKGRKEERKTSRRTDLHTSKKDLDSDK